jgi:actin-related protein
MDQAAIKQNLGGRDLTQLLHKRLLEFGHPSSSFSSSAGRDVLREFKEERCFVDDTKVTSYSPQRRLEASGTGGHCLPPQLSLLTESIDGKNGEMSARSRSICDSRVRPYQLPDGTVLDPSKELLTSVAEALFHPMELLGAEALGAHEMIAECIQSCAIDLRADLYKSIVLSGGNTMFPGLVPR